MFEPIRIKPYKTIMTQRTEPKVLKYRYYFYLFLLEGQKLVIEVQ